MKPKGEIFLSKVRDIQISNQNCTIWTAFVSHNMNILHVNKESNVWLMYNPFSSLLRDFPSKLKGCGILSQTRRYPIRCYGDCEAFEMKLSRYDIGPVQLTSYSTCFFSRNNVFFSNNNSARTVFFSQF